MSRDESKRWDEGLSGILAAEKSHVDAPEDAEARVWGRVARSLAVPAPSDEARRLGPLRGRHPSRVSLGSVYLLGVLTGVGGALVAVRAAPRPPAVVAPAEASSVDHEVLAPAVVTVQTATAEPALAPRPPRPQAAPPAVATPLTSTLAGERVLLDQARAALSAGDGAAALRATDAHEKRYEGGVLAEEREAIAIQALLLVSRYDDARLREASFERKYPHSMLLQAVRASVESIP